MKSDDKQNRQMFEDYDEFDDDSFKDMIDNMIDIIEEDQNDHIPTKSNGSFTGAKTPRELSNWMKSNIKYAQFKKLESAEEVYHSKKGSCHDQVMFELHELSAMGYIPHAMFLIEYREGSNQGGMTHSFVYYRDKTGQVYWFENAWTPNAGIHKFNSIHDIKRYFKNAYKNKKFGNYNKFGNLKFSSFGKHKPGESLDTFVRICLS